MARGQPDYGNPNYSVAQVPFDPSLFMVALKGVNTVDGMGRVWRVTNYSDGLGAWGTDAGGDGTSPKLFYSVAEVGDISIKMVPGTLAGVGESTLAQAFILTSPPRLGIEHGIYVDNFSPDYYITMDYRITGSSFTAGYKFSESTRKIYILQNNTYVEIVSMDTQTIAGGWMSIKLTVDFSTRKYVRLVYGQTVVDLSSYSTDSQATNGIGLLYTTIRAVANAANNSPAYIGHSIITLDEP